jgi:hypothetical protein
MGWSSGSGLFSLVIESIKNNVLDHGERVEIYKGLIDSFEEFDWDTQDECLGEDPAYDEALYELHPNWNEEDEDD